MISSLCSFLRADSESTMIINKTNFSYYKLFQYSTYKSIGTLLQIYYHTLIERKLIPLVFFPETCNNNQNQSFLERQSCLKPIFNIYSKLRMQACLIGLIVIVKICNLSRQPLIKLELLISLFLFYMRLFFICDRTIFSLNKNTSNQAESLLLSV